MELRIRRFEKEKHLLPTIQVNDTYINMPINPELSLTIPSNYPFVPPLLKVNGIYYIRYFDNKIKRFKTFMERYHIQPYSCCLCCSSITGDKWTPCFGINELMKEYYHYTHILNLIVTTKMVLDKIELDDLIHSTIIQYLF